MSTTPTPDTTPIENLPGKGTREHAAWLADVLVTADGAYHAHAADLLRQIATDTALETDRRLAAVYALYPLDPDHGAELLAMLAADRTVAPRARAAAARVLANLGRAVNAPDPLPTGSVSASTPQRAPQDIDVGSARDNAGTDEKRRKFYIEECKKFVGSGEEMLALAIAPPTRHATDNQEDTTGTSTTAVVDLLVAFERSSLGTDRARAARRRTPPATIGQILARSHDAHSHDKTDPADSPDLPRLLEELNRLRHGGGLQEAHPQIGPMLAGLAALDPDNLDGGGSLVRLQLTNLLDSALGQLPHELATTFTTLTNLRPERGHQTLPRRIEVLATQTDVDPRTIQRRWHEAARLVAEHLLRNEARSRPRRGARR